MIRLDWDLRMTGTRIGKVKWEGTSVQSMWIKGAPPLPSEVIIVRSLRRGHAAVMPIINSNSNYGFDTARRGICTEHVTRVDPMH